MRLQVPVARALLMGATLLSSGCALGQVTSRLAGSQTSGAEALEKRPDEGITSDLHAAYQGQIVFSTREIPKSNPAQDELAAEFTSDATIYGRAFFPHSLENHPIFVGDHPPIHNTTPTVFYRLYVDGEPVTWQVELRDLPFSKRTLTTYQVWIRPASTDAATSREWVKIVDGLAPGPHELKLELWTGAGSRKARTPLASGTFILHKKAGRGPRIGKTFSDLEQGLDDPKLAATMLELASSRARRDGWKQSLVASKVMSADWTLVRHKLTGIAIRRNIFGWVDERWPDGRCTAESLLFQQEIVGERPTGAITLSGYGKQVDIDCEDVAASDEPGQEARPQLTVTAAESAPASSQPLPEAVPAEKTTPLQPEPSALIVADAPEPAEPRSSPPQTTVASREPTRAGPQPQRVALRSAAPSSGLRAHDDASARSTRRSSKHLLVNAGAAVNALESSGLASYVGGSGRISALDLGLGVTWPLNVIGHVRVDLLPGSLELGPMLSGAYLAAGDSSQFAIAGGLFLGVPLYQSAVELGLRVDAQASYDIDVGAFALPVITSSYMRF